MLTATSTTPNWGPRSASGPVPSFSDPYWDLAAGKLTEKGISQTDHVLLQENVATYLANGASHEGSRFNLKMQRDLSQPYKDQEVFAHVDELQQSLVDNLAAIPVTPRQVYVNGSFARGRLGVNSDLDALIALDGKDRQADLKPLISMASDTSATVFPIFLDDLNYNRTVFMISGSSRKVETEDLKNPTFLREKYAEELRARGILKDEAGCHKVAATPHRREIQPTFEKVMETMWKEGQTVEHKWDSLMSDSWKARTNRTAFRVAGALCGLPVVGALFEKAADVLVTQDHG